MEDLELLLEGPIAPESPTWADILRDDPFDNSEGLWDNVDFAEASSESADGSLLDDTDEWDKTSRHSIANVEDARLLAKRDGFAANFDHLQEILERKNSFLTAFATESRLTESQVIREIIFMLLGLPSTLFERVNGLECKLKAKITIQNLDAQTVEHILQEVCDIGTQLAAIRDFTDKREAIPVLQTLQASLLSRLQTVDQDLSQIAKRILEWTGSIVTLTTILPAVVDVTGSLTLVNRALPSESLQDNQKGIFVLEGLHQLAREEQALGEPERYFYIAEIFFECFRTYLKPIEAWIQDGILDDHNGVLFIKRSSKSLPLSSLWSEQYSLVRDERGNIPVPSFMQPLALMIFASGKTINFSKALGQTAEDIRPVNEPRLTFTSVCHPGFDEISPFEELFTSSLEQWIERRRSVSSAHLLSRLASQCNLLGTLDAFEHVYFGRNGYLTGQVAYTIFDRIDKGKRWQDKFALTDIFRDAFNSIPSIDKSKLSVRIAKNLQLRGIKQRSVLQFEYLLIDYELPWPLATIIRPETTPVYQHVAVLLLQLLRAQHVLSRLLYSPMSPAEPTTVRNLALSLRHRLHWFVETVQNYIVKEALAPMMTKLRSEISKAGDLDTMVAVHASCAAELESSCILANQQNSTHQALVSLIDLGIVFSDLYSTNVFRNAATDDWQHTTDDADSSEDEVNDSSSNRNQSLESPEIILEKLENISTTYARLLNFIFLGARDGSRSRKGGTLQRLVDLLKFGTTEP